MLFFVTACKLDRKSAIARDKFTYKYTDDSFLFFRNLRQIYYDFQDLPDAEWYALRWSDRYKGNKYPALNPVIVVDRSRKETYVLVEPNEPLQSEDILTIRETNSRTGKKYSYSLAERGRENMLEFATKIYEGIMAENKLEVHLRGSYQPLFGSDSDKDSFRVVMADYYRLIHVFTNE